MTPYLQTLQSGSSGSDRVKSGSAPLFRSNSLQDKAHGKWVTLQPEKGAKKDKSPERRTAELLASFEDHLEVRGYKRRGIEDKVDAAARLARYLAECGLEPGEVTLREAEAYRDHLASRVKAVTVNGAITRLRRFYRYLVECGETSCNPFTAVEKLKAPESMPPAVPTVKEMRRLLGRLPLATVRDFKFRVAVEVLYGTGMRIGELEGLLRRDVGPEAVLIRDDKERQDRYVPLTDCASRMLQLFIESRPGIPGDAALFGSGARRTFSRWMDWRLKAACRRLSLPAFSCHSLRYAAATHMFAAGADLREVQKILGHRRIHSTEGYTRLLTDDLRRVVERAHPRERLR